MKRENQKSDDTPKQNALHSTEITSESIENAHASGDGTMQKSDEIIPGEEETGTSPEKEAY